MDTPHLTPSEPCAKLVRNRVGYCEGVLMETRKLVSVVENDHFSGELIAKFLRKCDYEVRMYVGTEPDIVERCTEGDLVLMDMGLGILTGPQLCRRLRCQDGTVPVLGMTSFEINYYMRDLRAAGAQGLLYKEELDRTAAALAQLAEGRPLDGWETPEEAHERVVREAEEEARLTLQEEKVLNGYRLTGGNTSSVGSFLNITASTVRKHLQAIREKLGMGTSHDLLSDDSGTGYQENR